MYLEKLFDLVKELGMDFESDFDFGKDDKTWNFIKKYIEQNNLDIIKLRLWNHTILYELKNSIYEVKRVNYTKSLVVLINHFKNNKPNLESILYLGFLIGKHICYMIHFDKKYKNIKSSDFKLSQFLYSSSIKTLNKYVSKEYYISFLENVDQYLDQLNN